MSEKNTDIQAFPHCPSAHYEPGMTLRDYFAIHSDQPGVQEIVTAAGLTYSNGQVWTDEQTSVGPFDVWYRKLAAIERFALYAKVRYQMADAMLKAREQ